MYHVDQPRPLKSIFLGYSEQGGRSPKAFGKVKMLQLYMKIVPNFGKLRILQLYGEDSFLMSANLKYFSCMLRIVS